MTAREQLEALAKRLRTSADLYRSKANGQDRYASYIEAVAAMDEEQAKAGLEFLMKQVPAWFSGVN